MTHRTHLAHLPDAPETFPDRYQPYLGLAAQCATWRIFTEYIDAHLDTVTRPENLTRAIYKEPGDKGGGLELCRGSQEAMDGLLAEFSGVLPRSPHDLRVLLAWVRCARHWLPVPEHYSAHHDDYWWAPVRMLLAGAGYKAWRRLASELSADSRCPFDPEESEETWIAAVRRAHIVSGWPVQLTSLPFPRIARIFATASSTAEGFPPSWLKALAFLHVIKYVRRKPDGRILLAYRGIRRVLNTQTATDFTALPRPATLWQGLGVSAVEERHPAHIHTQATQAALATLNFNDLLHLKPLAELPPNVIAGAWTSYAPDPTPDTKTWLNHGLILDGAKYARQHARRPEVGVIRDLQHDDEITLGFDWNVDNALNSEHLRRREFFWQTLPDEFQAQEMPFDTLLKFFPNISEASCPDNILAAYRAIHDSVVFASLLRHEVPALSREFPIVVCLPWSATIEDSTNTGKTTAAVCWGRALCPSLPTTASSSPDSNSAPDKRTIITQLREHGTAVLDEFISPRTDHPLAKRHLQTLATGGLYNGGLVLENDGRVGLRHSLILSAKAITRWGPDMMTRTYAMWLGPLTDDQRLGRMDFNFEDINSGRASMEIRLAAWNILTNQPVREYLSKMRVAATEKARFNTHFSLAQLALELRDGPPAGSPESEHLIDAAAEWMQARLLTHADQAVHSGVEEEMEQNHTSRLHLTSVMGAHEDPAALREVLESTPGVDAGLSVEQFLASVAGSDAGNCDLSADGIVRWWHHATGVRFHSRKQLISAVSRMLTDNANRGGGDYVTPPDDCLLGHFIWRRRRGRWYFMPRFAEVEAENRGC